MNQKPQIQVYCNQEDWMSSLIQVVNVKATSGLIVKPNYTSIKGNQLPTDSLRPIFAGIIEQFRTEGNQQWFASIVFVERIPKIERTVTDTVYEKDADGNLVLDSNGMPIIVSQTDRIEVVQNDGVKFSYRVDNTDGTANTSELISNDAHAILLFDTLTDKTFWETLLNK